MNQTFEPVATNQTTRQGSVVIAYHESPQCYFRPETEEMVFIAPTESGAFEAHWRGMQARMDAFHQADAAYSSALEKYIGLQRAGMLPHERDEQEKVMSAAEQKLADERKALQDKLGEFSTSGMAYDDVVELIPVVGQNVKGRKGSRPNAYAYVNRGYFSNSARGRKLHSVSIKSAEKKGGAGSFISKDKYGNTYVDVQKIYNQLSTLDWPKIKLDLKDVLKWTGSDFDPESLCNDAVLFDWAESWNKSLTFDRADSDNKVDLSGGAQFMRFVSNVGAGVDFDPHKGNVAIKGEAKASLTLAAGTVIRKAYIPDRMGWAWAYTHANGQVFDMGYFRLLINSELSGFIGASVTLEGQLQVVTKGDKQLLAGQPGGRLPRFRERRTRGAVFHQQMLSEDEGLKLTGEGFAGARVEGSLKGSLQWLKPAEPDDPETFGSGLLKSSGEYADFCSIAGSVAGLAGLGAGGKFYCAFINGKFCFNVAASLCWGAGAKGAVACEVGANTIVEFGAWLIYQLYRLNYGFFSVIEKDAFANYSKFCVLQMMELQSDVVELYGGLSERVGGVAEYFTGLMGKFLDVGDEGLKASRERNALAQRVILYRQRLLQYTPEAKGMLLYLLTRHSKWDRLDLENQEGGWIPDVFKARKDAVVWVLTSVQTLAEWRKVMCRITRDGGNLSISGDDHAVEVEQEQKLIDFLRIGFNRDQDLYKAKQKLLDVKARLRSEAAWGYAIAMNDTSYYQVNIGQNPHFPLQSSFEYGDGLRGVV